MSERSGDVTVLVVDDDADIRDSVCEVIEDAGYLVAAARDGVQALEYLATHPLPDLILLDLMMPRMDGWTFRRHQLADLRLAAVPTFVLTAGAIEPRIARLGLSGWLRKPISVTMLLDVIDRHHGRPGRAPSPGGLEGHTVAFYEDEERRAEAVARYIAVGLAAGEGVLVAASHGMRRGLGERLSARCVDVAATMAEGQLAFLDAHETVARILVGGRPSEEAFLEVLHGAVPRGYRRLRAYGELVDLLWRRDDIEGAITLEGYWNRFLLGAGGVLHCGYSTASSPAQRAAMARVRDLHALAAAR